MAENADIFLFRLEAAEDLVFEGLPVPHPFIAPANAGIVDFDQDFLARSNFWHRNFGQLKTARTVPIRFTFVEY